MYNGNPVNLHHYSKVHSFLDSGTSFILCVKSGGMPATHGPNLKSELHNDMMSLSPGLQSLLLGELYSSWRSWSRREEHKVNSLGRLLPAECFVCVNCSLRLSYVNFSSFMTQPQALCYSNKTDRQYMTIGTWRISQARRGVSEWCKFVLWNLKVWGKHSTLNARTKGMEWWPYPICC